MWVLSQMFKTPNESLGDLGAQSAASLIAAATDVALVIDTQGVIRDVAFNKDELSLELDGHGRWRGSKLVSTVTADARAKAEELLRDAVAKKSAIWRQVNHPAPGGSDIPVLYSAVNIGRDDRFVLVGRDLRQLATMQRRLISAQQSMERDYIRLRDAETRYRLLFQVSSEAVVMVDAQSQLIVEANPAALALLDEAAPKLTKSDFVSPFASSDRPAILNFLSDVRATGRDSTLEVQLAKAPRRCELSASLFRQEGASLFLVRLASQQAMAGSGAALKATALLLRYFEVAPDALAITENDGKLLKVNTAFLDMAQLGHEEQIRGENLDRWLGRAGIDFGIVLANLRQSGAVKMFATVLRGTYGSVAEVEISAIAVSDGAERSGFGFAIRNVEKRLSAAVAGELPRSMAQLTEMVGRVPLRDLVRETTDVIERLSIEAALELTGDNRASAAEMLGLSRQSLYVKLRRFGLEHAADDDDK
jgi:transcriptional regulator PpsR